MTEQLSPQDRAAKAEAWLKAYPWQSEDHQKAFLHFVQHMRGPAAKCAGPQTDLQCLAAFMFGKDLEAVEWWRELLTSTEAAIRSDLVNLLRKIETQDKRIEELEQDVKILTRNALNPIRTQPPKQKA